MKLRSVKEKTRRARESICSLRAMAEEIELFRVRLFICKINHPGLYTVWGYFYQTVKCNLSNMIYGLLNSLSLVKA